LARGAWDLEGDISRTRILSRETKTKRGPATNGELQNQVLPRQTGRIARPVTLRVESEVEKRKEGEPG